MPHSALAGKVRKRFTPEEYLALERAAPEKSEFYDGEIFAMAGAGESHNIITANVLSALLSLLRKRGCQACGSDMRIGVNPQGPFFYPDVSVACGERKFQDGRRDTLLNPAIVVEVLSKSTQRFDRGIKLEEYKRIATVQAVLLISSDRELADVHIRSGRGWKHSAVAGADRIVELPTPRCVVPMAEIYEGVDLTGN